MNVIKEEWILDGKTYDHEVEDWDKHIQYHELGYRTEFNRSFPSIYMEKYDPNGRMYYEKDTFRGTERAFQFDEAGVSRMVVLVPYWDQYGISYFEPGSDEASRKETLSKEEASRLAQEWVAAAESVKG